MVVQGDIVRILVGGVLPHLGNLGEQLRPLQGVGLHQLIFLGRQTPFLVQNGVRDGDLPHIMGNGAHPDEPDLLL